MSNLTSTTLSSTAAAPIVGLELLGYGYNIFTSSYCDESQRTECLISDLDCTDSHTKTVTLPLFKEQFLVPNIVDYLKDQSSGNSYTIMAETSEKFTSQLAVKAGCSGNYGAFSASVDVSFSNSSSSYLENIYCEHGYVFAGFSLRLPHLVSDLRKYVKPEIKNALLNDTPEEIIKNYGTHVITSVVIGAKCRMRQWTNRSEITSATEWSEAVSAEYGAIAANTSIDNKFSSDIKSFRMDAVIETLGGNNQPINNMQDYSNWAESAHSNPAIIDHTGMVPIWQLLDPDPLNKEESDKREALKEAIQLYSRQFQIGLLYDVIQQFTSMNSTAPWVPQVESFGRQHIWIEGTAWSQEYQKSYSHGSLWQSTGKEALKPNVPEGLVVYGGRQLLSNDTSTAPFVEVSSWGTRVHPATQQPLEAKTVQFFKEGGMSMIQLFVGPVKEAVKGAYVIVGGSSICNNEMSSWGATATDGRQSVLAGSATSWNVNGNDFYSSQIYLVIEDACQSLPEAPGESI